MTNSLPLDLLLRIKSRLNGINSSQTTIFNALKNYAQVGKRSIPYVEFGAITSTTLSPKEESFLLNFDGILGLALHTNETGSAKRKILSPIAALVNNSRMPLLTIFQKPYGFYLIHLWNLCYGRELSRHFRIKPLFFAFIFFGYFQLQIIVCASKFMNLFGEDSFCYFNRSENTRKQQNSQPRISTSFSKRFA